LNDKKYQGDHQQQVNEAAKRVACYQPEQPKNQQDNQNSPKHFILPSMYLYGTFALQSVSVSEHVRSAENPREVWLQGEYHWMMLQALPRIPLSKKEHAQVPEWHCACLTIL
jgi:hypothetical protein